MAHRRESRQAAKRLTARSCLQRVTTATHPSITPHSDGLTHAFCQGAEPQRWSLFNLHADTLPHSLSLSSLFHKYIELTHTHTQLTRTNLCTYTHRVCMPADTVKHKHICMYVPVLKKHPVLPFSANNTANTLHISVWCFFHCSQNTWHRNAKKDFYETFKHTLIFNRLHLYNVNVKKETLKGCNSPFTTVLSREIDLFTSHVLKE